MASPRNSLSKQDSSLFFIPPGSPNSPFQTGREKKHFRFDSTYEQSECLTPGQIITYQAFTPDTIKDISWKEDKATITDQFQNSEQTSYTYQNKQLREELLANTQDYMKLLTNYKKLSQEFSQYKLRAQFPSQLQKIVNLSEQLCEEKPSSSLSYSSVNLYNYVLGNLQIVRSRMIRLTSKNVQLAQANQKMTLQLQTNPLDNEVFYLKKQVSQRESELERLKESLKKTQRISDKRNLSIDANEDQRPKSSVLLKKKTNHCRNETPSSKILLDLKKGLSTCTSSIARLQKFQTLKKKYNNFTPLQQQQANT